MERIAAHSGIQTRERKLANETRLGIGITTIAELVALRGNRIPYRILYRGWRATPAQGMQLPMLLDPSKEHGAAFRKCTRLTFCNSASPYQHTADYTLDESLGK